MTAISSWPLSLTLDRPGVGDILFCHATPSDDNEIFTHATPEDSLVSRFSGLAVETVVCGHTHMQFDRVVGGVRVINAGSVGMPFGQTGAFWLRIEGDDFALRRTEYDLDEATRVVEASGYPLPFPIASPPSAEEMLALFRSRELSP